MRKLGVAIAVAFVLVLAGTTFEPAQAREYSLAVERWRPLVSRYGWPEAEAMAVLHCESSGRERVVSKSNAVGLFQIKTDDLYKTPVRSLRVIQYLFPEVRDSWSASESLLQVPERNVAIAYIRWLDAGWDPWACGWAASRESVN